ncbi:MAG: PKD domain-containing protein [Bacteroidota bacterium]
MNVKLTLLLFFFGFSFSVLATPNADFTLSSKQGCLPLTVNYTDRSTGSPTRWEWDFGNGNKSTLQNPSAIYYKAGNFTISLTIWDAAGNQSTKTFNPVRVFRSPIADFVADTVGCVGDPLNFTDKSTKADTSITKWTWDYGDGNLSNAQNSSHAYTYASKFTIGLTVTDGHGCKSLETKNLYVRIKPKPIVDFQLSGDFSCTIPVSFVATNKSSGASKYDWSTNNGGSSTSKDYNFSFNSFGNYTVTLKASHNGCTATMTKPVTVQKIVADFSKILNKICEESTIVFTNNSKPRIKSTTYEWDFGDGFTDTSFNPTHEFNTPGTFKIMLKVTNGGCWDTISKTITVVPKPKLNITMKDSVGCTAPATITFNISGASVTFSDWDFGDKSGLKTFTGNILTTSHVYNKNGSYRVIVSYADATGCVNIDTLKTKVKIGMQKIKIDPETVVGCVPKTQDFKIKGSPLYQNIKSYEWKFNDSAYVYTTATINRTFTKRGNYTLIAKITTDKGCIVADTISFELGQKWDPSFYIKKPKHYCGFDTIHWVNTTQPDSMRDSLKFKLYIDWQRYVDPADTTAWLFKSKKDSLTYVSSKKGGKYLVRLEVNDKGCISKSQNVDTINLHGPYPKLIAENLDCKYDKFKYTATTSWSNRWTLKLDDSLLNYTGPFKYTYKKNKKNIFILRAWNDTFNCYDSTFPIYPKKFDYPIFNSQQSSPCAPSVISAGYMGKYKSSKWFLPNGDSVINKNSAKYTAKEPGLYLIKFTGFTDSLLCADTNYFHYAVNGVKLRGNVITSGKCLPITLNLIDSSAGTDGNVHTWQIGDDFVSASSMYTPYTINSVGVKDTAIIVKHMVSSPSGCTTEKRYSFPFSGPKISYKVSRFAVCDTPMFYFDASVVDSLKTKFPVNYDWKYSDGTQKNGIKVSGKFKVIGMNYFTFTATDNMGCKVIYNDSFEVSPNMLQPLFKADPTGRFCPPLECSFTDMSKTFNSKIVKWEWEFGDGTTSQLVNPKKLYLVPGKYDITLKITSLSGCTAILKKPAYVIVNGPRGFYDFDRGNACLPHTVEFRGKAIDSASMEWDLGDGVVRDGNNFKHTYTRRGRYIPAMILSDTLGCKYTLPPIDTIEVFDYPQATLSVKGLCFHSPLKVKNQSISNHEDPKMTSQWFFNGQSKSPGPDSMYRSTNRGYQEVTLIVENKGGCKDTVSAKVKVFAPVAQFSPSLPMVCLGNPLKFNNQSTSDTTLKSFDWDFDDNSYSTLEHPSHMYQMPGEYDVQLIAGDVVNCYDTIRKPASAVVGDTVAPPLVPIRRASVYNNRTVELMYSKFPTFDFTKYIIYRESNGNYYKMAEVTNQDDTIYYDKQCNTLSQSYCYKISTQNLCLLRSPLSASDEHCTIETKAYGKFEANTVKWSPYIGFDSIDHYEIWRQNYDNKGEAYTYLNSVPSTQRTYVDTLITCFTRQNYRIVAKQFNGFKEYSNSDTATAKPYYINTNTPNYAWRATVEEDKFARVEWLNNAWSRNGMKAYLLTKQLTDGSVMFSNKYFNLLDTVYDDKFTNVQERSYVYTVKGIDNCGDTTPLSNIAQTILLKCYFDETTQKPALRWNHYNKWAQGISHYEIEQKMLDGTFVNIGRVSATDTQFIHMGAQQNCTPFFRYRVRAISFTNSILNHSTFSLSNEADAFPRSTLFVPNAFSPDKNNINEAFGPQGQYIHQYKFQVYNRWGEKIFETTNCMEAWNGYFKDERCEQDVYLYKIEAMGADKKIYTLKGTFHLLR